MREVTRKELQLHSEAMKRIRELEAEKARLLDVVTRIRQWVALNIPNADGTYWRKELDTAMRKEKP